MSLRHLTGRVASGGSTGRRRQEWAHPPIRFRCATTTLTVTLRRAVRAVDVSLASVILLAAIQVGPVGAQPIGPERPPPDPRSTPPSPPLAQRGARGERVAALALQYVGAPYRWGGTSPAGFDCSGLVRFVYAQVGVAVPHDVLGQLEASRRVAIDALLPGDVLVFRDTYRPGPSHSGIYLGDGRFVHAADERRGVTVNSIREGSWAARLHGASRPGQ
jgi:cell wall-associated NlpC family hydrolase